MLRFSDSKSMANALRKALAERRIEITHSDSLELVARQFGYANWNILAAQIERDSLPRLALPEGWFVSHPAPEYYRIGLDPEHPGEALVASVGGADIPEGRTGVMMQSVEALPHLGRRMRFSAELRCEDIVGTGSIWMRVDPQSGRFLRFDNMLNHGDDAALRGTEPWRLVEVILDVPEGAASIHFGLLLSGRGRLWARDLRLEPVEDDRQPTAWRPFLPRPTNLDFRQSRGAG